MPLNNLHTTDWQRELLHTAEDVAFPGPGDASSSAAGLARFAAADDEDGERRSETTMRRETKVGEGGKKPIDWKEVRRRENFWLKRGRWPTDDEMEEMKNRRGPTLMFGLNTVSR